MYDLVIENTQHSLLIYFLIKNVNNAIYILDSELDKKIIFKIKKITGGRIHLFNYNNNKKGLKRFLYVYILEKIKMKKFIKDYNNYSDVYGNDDLVSFDIFRNFNYILLEDGIMNYEFKNQRQKEKLKKMFRDLLRGFRKNKPFGLSKNCKKILLTGIAPIPKEIAQKVEIINLKELWDKKSKEEQEEILDIFSFTNEIIKKLECRDIILLTQPISEDKIVTEQEKIEIYKKCLEKYDFRDVIIKIHPREKTNYSKYFPDVLILDHPFPFELITLIKIKFEKVITLFSTAALDLGEDMEVEWLGTKVHPKLKDHFGEITLENIIKKDN